MSNTTTAADVQNVIFTLRQGTMINIQVANTNNYLTPVGVAGDALIISTGPGGNDATFVVAYAETDGVSVKVGLQCYQSPFSWGLNSAVNYPNSIGLQQANPVTTFILTAAPGNNPFWANIQAASTPPAPYLRMVVNPATDNQYLARGFNDAGIQGTFQIGIVG